VALSRRPTDQPATRYLYVNGSPGAAAGAFCRRRQQITYERTGDATQWPPVVIGRAASADQPDYQPTDRRLSFNTGDDGGGAGQGPAPPPPPCAPLRPSTYIKRHRNAAAAAADTATALAPAAASSHNRTPRALAAATAPAIEKCDI